MKNNLIYYKLFVNSFAITSKSRNAYVITNWNVEDNFKLHNCWARL